jgi:hypothetical protein
MIEITEDGRKIYSRGDPPPAGQEWRSMPAVMKKLGIGRTAVWYHIRKENWTIYRQNRNRTWILKSDVDSYLEFNALRKHWRKRHQPKAWREEVCTEFDEETCKRIFWTAAQAALYMDVTAGTIGRWGRKGKIPVFITRKKGTGGRYWYSPSSLRYMKEDEQHLKERAKWKKGNATKRANIVYRQVYKLRHKPSPHRKPIPPGWLTTLQAAERLDISLTSVHGLRRRGRLRGKQYYKGELTNLYGWEPMIKTRGRHWFFHEDDVEALKNDEHYIRTREIGKTAAWIAARKPTRL